MTLESPKAILERFHRTLVDEIRSTHSRYLHEPFTVAEIYQQLIPYRTHRDAIGVEMNGDYEDALLRLLAGEGGYLELQSETARDRLREELQTQNPDTGLFRDFAAVEVRLKSEGPTQNGEEEETVEDAPTDEKGAPEGEGDTRAAGSFGGEACRSCGASLPERDDVVYCPHCGTDQRLVPCSSCGTELEPEWRYCVSCGQAAES